MNSVVTEGVPVWQGGCTYKNSDGDVFWINWSSKPVDTGTENRDAPKGTFAQRPTLPQWMRALNVGNP
jgi:hypothetical protein